VGVWDQVNKEPQVVASPPFFADSQVAGVHLSRLGMVLVIDFVVEASFDFLLGKNATYNPEGARAVG
jgi:hypothetical protein